MAKNNNLLLYGGAAVAAYLLFFNKSSATPVNTTQNYSNIPPPPAVYSQAYYEQYQYPAMLAANPNVGNPNYRLTDAEANQYLQNYLDLAQGLQLEATNGMTIQDAARRHWTNHGVAEKRTFLPLMPQDKTPFVPPPANNNASSGSWITSALGIATSVVGLLGPGDVTLNQREAEVLINGGAILKNILPLFSEDPREVAIDKKLTVLLEKYTDGL